MGNVGTRDRSGKVHMESTLPREGLCLLYFGSKQQMPSHLVSEKGK
jgi:hypothetical protein